MKIKLVGFLWLALCVGGLQVSGADEIPPWRVDASIAFTAYQEQAKNKSGDSGGKLFQNIFGAGLLSGTRQVSDWFGAGAFFFFESGLRTAAEYTGVDSAGVPVPGARVGGNYSTYWLGPILRFSYKAAFAEAGYIAFGKRPDRAYPGLVSTAGSVGSFSVDPAKAWLLTLGFGVPIGDVQLTARVEYRYLYYKSRGGERLANDLLYGNQAIRPHLGVAFRF